MSLILIRPAAWTAQICKFLRASSMRFPLEYSPYMILSDSLSISALFKKGYSFLGLETKPRKLYPCVKKADIERESESIMYGLYSKGILIEEALKNLQIGAVKAAGRIRIKDLIEVLKL